MMEHPQPHKVHITHFEGVGCHPYWLEVAHIGLLWSFQHFRQYNSSIGSEYIIVILHERGHNLDYHE